MACGAACILTDTGGVNDYARHEYNAILVPRGDAAPAAASPATAAPAAAAPTGGTAYTVKNGDTLWAIANAHGTTVPSSIGRAVSSGCIRMLNADVADLYERVPVGTEVVVLQGSTPFVAEDVPPPKRKRKFLFE